jgi:hypothetical protein
MIAKAKAISHGINDLRYITGESQHKKHPEKIYRVLDNLLPSQPDAMGIWNSMQLTLSQYRPIKNSVIRIELSPSPEHTQFYDIEDWQTLWQEFAEEFDRQVITGKNGKVRSCPTNLAGSKYSVWLHTESKGEVPHLHAAICRLDEDGNINNDHDGIAFNTSIQSRFTCGMFQFRICAAVVQPRFFATRSAARCARR